MGVMCVLVWAVPGLCFDCCICIGVEEITDPGMSVAFVCWGGKGRCFLEKDLYHLCFFPPFGITKIQMWAEMSIALFDTCHWYFGRTEREEYGSLIGVLCSEGCHCCCLCVV